DPELRVGIECRPDASVEDALEASPCAVTGIDGRGIAVLSEDLNTALEAVEAAANRSA
ncbi:MAG: hypothetical protein ACI944_001951, partial [Natronomonas sp.]